METVLRKLEMLTGINGNFPNQTSKEIDKNTQILQWDHSIKNCNRLGQHLTSELQDCQILNSEPKL